ncbi:hypothetical protein HWV62_7750 [Athelia sp. TMB]|nr:hypothetical protein HWV62_7750 [Athelia sp. TMB]
MTVALKGTIIINTQAQAMTSILPKVMRAVVCPSVPIPPSGLVYTTSYPAPSPKAGHVLIQVKAFGLNRSELFTRQGHSPGIKYPRVLGIECVGEVADSGGSDIWKVGDKVAAIMGGMGRQFDGGYAEYTSVPQQNVSLPISLPSNIGWAEFAAIPETFLTAWGTLDRSLALSSSDTLLIRGGSSSVGMAAATLAKVLFSCPRVISTTRAQGKIDSVKAGGADEVVIEVDGRVNQDVMRITNSKGADKCIELIGGTVLSDTCASVGPEGVISIVGCVGGEWSLNGFDYFAALAPNKSLKVFTSDKVDIRKSPLQKIVDMVSSGKMKLGLDKVFNIEQAGEAQEYMEANSATGKVVCIVG